jgi:hypothetical protein
MVIGPVRMYERLGSFARDAAPSGSKVDGTGENSLGYAQNSRTTSTRRGKIETLGQERSDAVANVLATWATGAEVEIVEDGDITYLCLWTPLQSGEGRPEDAIATNAIGKTSVVDRVAEARDARLGRYRDHNAAKPAAARRALAQVKRDVDSLESIAARNREFWGKK